MVFSSPVEDDALSFLATHGWLPLILSDHEGFVEAFDDLLKFSTEYFALDEEDSAKQRFQAATGALASEEGYSKIPSEKSILTVKTATHCPSALLSSVRKAWKLAGTFLSQLSVEIAKTLDLNPDVFAPFIDPCKHLPEHEWTPTLLRMFRYDRPEGPEPTVNAERHKDLGLLSLVVGNSPGLHVLNTETGLWVPIEEDAVLPPYTRTSSGGLTATLLVGETLTFLSRRVFEAGVHGVVCAPPSLEDEGEQYRYSIVFTLRPAIAPLFTSNFESHVTGQFPEEVRSEGKSSDELFMTIKNSHYNVNAAPDIRVRQREMQKKVQRQQAHGVKGQE